MQRNNGGLPFQFPFSVFLLYTSKGLVIHRVAFDEYYWESLQSNILEFYFIYMLP